MLVERRSLRANDGATVAFVFARGGSKGLPRKNVKPLLGKPLIGYSIEVALACAEIEAVIVSTDDEEIGTVARNFGAETPFRRPAELATDQASEWLAWQHAIRWYQEHRGPLSRFVSLPTTSPLRSVTDLQACLDLLISSPNTDIVVTGTRSNRSPYFNMVEPDSSGGVKLVKTGHGFTRRQDAPQTYDMTTVAYVARPDFIIASNGIFDGRVGMVEIPHERALDIDTEFDFLMAEFLMNNQGRAF